MAGWSPRGQLGIMSARILRILTQPWGEARDESVRGRMNRIKVGLAALALALVMAGLPGGADSPRPFSDFSAKRVKAPPKGQAPRIDVQISGQGNAVADVSGAADAPSPAAGSYAWFWQQISPRLQDSGGGRLGPALVQLANAPDTAGLVTPRLQDLLHIAQSHNRAILGATIGTRVSPALVLAVIAVESAGRAEAKSDAGAMGLMQLMPATAAQFGVTDPFDAAHNIQGGVAYLDLLMRRFDSDPILVLAAYNAGETAVQSARGVPDTPQVRAYVPRVLAAYSVARGLCRTPPELVSDGCVFALE